MHQDWGHTGWGGFDVDHGTLRTAPDPRGLGLLVYRKERFGNCELRVVFKAKDLRANSGAYVRLADGILSQLGEEGAALALDATGKIPIESRQALQAHAESRRVANDNHHLVG